MPAPSGKTVAMLHAALIAGRLIGGLLVLLAMVIGVSAAAAAMTEPERRGRMLDVGEGRRMRVVCDGPAVSTPTVWFEAGAFGFAAEWGSVQSRLTALGIRSCGYDRAGLGFSDPGPLPRDADAIAGDLEKLIVASGEKGPFLFVGHSAAGLYLRRYAGLHPQRVSGLVLVDAMTPEGAIASPFAGRFPKLARWAARGAALGLFWPLTFTSRADRVGLIGPAHEEKRRKFASRRHNRAAADEAAAWPESFREGVATAPYNPDWPIAVVLAGPETARPDLNNMRAQPALSSRHGRVERVADADHRTLLGEGHADRIVDAVRFVAGQSAAAAKPAV
jgi:pimeloyl-ACP methyl ester carboxylesterase